MGCGEETKPKQSADGGKGASATTTAGASSGGGMSAGGASAGGASSGGKGSGQSGSESSGGRRPMLTPDGPPYIGTGKVLTQPPYDWVGIVGSGQSLSTGAYSKAVSLTQPYKNLMLMDNASAPKYPIDGADGAQWAVVPLVEPHRPNVPGTFSDNLNYPNNIYHNDSPTGPGGETPHSGMANALSKAWASRGNKDDYITTHTAVGVGGFCLQYLTKGSTSFSAAVSEAKVYKKLADEAGKVYGVGGVIFTHGECDTTTKTADYGEKLYQLYQDFNTDLKAVTNQPNDIVLLASQQSSIKGGGYESSAVQLWRAGREHPGQIVCTGPKYAYGQYGIHMPGPSYERVGEKYGEVFDLIVNQGKAWKPLGPNKITREGKVISIAFDVPNPPLVWDTHLGKPHQMAHKAWAEGKGFEVLDANKNEVQIVSAEIEGDTVKLTLAAEPSSALTVGYALTADDTGDFAGRDADLIGLLRDSDTFEGDAAEMIDVSATKASKMLTAAGGALARRANLDIVVGAGVPEDTVIETITPEGITLSAPWGGETGAAKLSFHHNHYNYCVHFGLDVP
jgi:hypothetical protein